MTNPDCIIFKYQGKFAHFLRAEANASAPSYPFPPRTVLMGLVGAVLGFPKDESQTLLQEARLTVSGEAATTHWHTANLRKDPPAPLPFRVKKNDKGSSKAQRNTQIAQEWLFKPDFTVYAGLPIKFHNEFRQRLQSRAWHFSPCLGLSEMGANLEYLDCLPISPLPPGIHEISTPALKNEIELDRDALFKTRGFSLGIKSIRMPRSLTPDRIFSHADYLYALANAPLPLKTRTAAKIGEAIVQWL